MEERGRELKNWVEMVKKTINAKAKTGLQPISYSCEMDLQYLQDSRCAYTTTAKIQIHRLLMKNLKAKKPKLQLQKSKVINSSPLKSAEIFEKAWKKRKKNWQKEKKDKNNSTLASEVNIIYTS